MKKLMVLVLFIINVYACLPEGHPPVEGVDGDDGDGGELFDAAQGDSHGDNTETQDVASHDNVEDDEAFIGIDQVESNDVDHNDQPIDEKIDSHEVGIDSIKEDVPFDATQGDTKKNDGSEITGDDTPVGVDTPANVDTPVSVDTVINVDTTPSVDTIDCPAGYVYDPVEGCVSFCPADKYFESKLGKCAYYPCCDLSGQWEVSVLDPDTMDFTVYSITINQAVSYLSGELTLYNPLEISDCYGLLEKKSFSLNCSNAVSKLILTSGTTTETAISGFYSLDSKDKGIKNGAFNMTNTQ